MAILRVPTEFHLNRSTANRRSSKVLVPVATYPWDEPNSWKLIIMDSIHMMKRNLAY